MPLSLKRAQAVSNLPPITVDRTLAFQHPITQRAADYWTALRGSRPMPSRPELQPASMRSFLKFVSLLDIEPETGIYRVTLQSTHLVELFGDLRNRKFNELFPHDVAQRWRDCFNFTRDTGEAVRLCTQVATQGKSWLQCEVLIAPLSDAVESAKIASLFWVFASWEWGKEIGAL